MAGTILHKVEKIFKLLVFLQEKDFLIYTLILPADIFPGEGSIFTALYISLKKTKLWKNKRPWNVAEEFEVAPL